MSKKNKIVNHGFQPDVITPDQWVLGSAEQFAGDVLQPGGQWDNYLPTVELQHKFGVETSGCVSFGTLNAIEILLNRTLGLKTNFSDRWLAWNSGTTMAGNTPQKVSESLRKEGTPKEEVWPFENVSSFDDFYKEPPTETFKFAREFIENYEFNHDWVFHSGSLPEKQNHLREALKYSPVGVSVVAWVKGGDGLYTKNIGQTDTHWCVCYGYVEGKYWKIFDHYDQTHKKLAWDYDFGYAKRYSIKKRTTPLKPYNWFTSMIKKLFSWLF